MFRTAPRAVLRQSVLPTRSQRMGVRFVSTGPPKRRSLKNSLARWGIAIGGIYWYNTSPIFNEPPAYTIQGSGSDGEEALPTIASVAASSRLRPPHPSESPIIPSTPTANSPPSINPKSPDPRDPQAPRTGPIAGEGSASSGDPSALQEEAAQQGAFNEETGEINWDCPCLGGMAHGPCGQDFRDAFSCFVYSDKEPKGIDCIDNFEKMQLCFRAHPEVYASEIEDDENTQRELEEEVARESQTLKPASTAGMPDVDQPSVWTPGFEESGESQVRQPADEAKRSSSTEANSSPTPASTSPVKPKSQPKPKKDKKPVYDEVADTVKDTAQTVKERSLAAGRKVKEEFGSSPTRDEGDSAVPKAAHDAR